MATREERNWTAHVVLNSEHFGLRPYFKALEDEMYRVLARVDEPHGVREYMAQLGCASRDWLQRYRRMKAEK